MRAIWLVVLVLGCEPAYVAPDAGLEVDAPADFPISGEFWPCYFWDEVSDTVDRCSPKCSNETLLGRLVWGENNTCEYAPGVFCPTERMTDRYDRGAGCCLYIAEPERVQLMPCF